MDDFTPDNQIISSDDFTPDNAGMTGQASTVSPIDRFRQFYKTGMLGPVAKQVGGLTPQGQMVNAAFPPTPAPQPNVDTFERSNQYPNQRMTDPSVSDFLTVQGAVQGPKAAAGILDAGTALSGAVKDKIKSLIEILKAPGEADTLASTATDLESGLNAKSMLGSELEKAKATKNALYNVVPKDIKASLPTLNSEAENILNEIKGLSPKTQSEVKALVSNYQDFGRKGAALGDIGVERSVLGDLAYNGTGIEKMYAARLGKALKADVENFANTPVIKPLSQQETEFAPELRKKWVQASEAQNNIPDTVVDHEVKYWQGSGPELNNSDIGQNIKKANDYYKDFASLQQHPVTQALAKARPEDMAAQVFRRGNVDDVNVAKAVLGDGYKHLQGPYYNQLKESKNLPAALSKLSDEFLNAAFTPAQVTNLKRLAQFNGLVKKAKLAATAIGAGAAVKYSHLFSSDHSH